MTQHTPWQRVRAAVAAYVDSRAGKEAIETAAYDYGQALLDAAIGDPLGELVDITAAAAALGTSPRHVRRLVYERRLPYFKVGGKVRIDRRELAAWVDRSLFPVEPRGSTGSGSTPPDDRR